MKGILLDADTADIIVAGGNMQLGDTQAQTVALVLDTAPGEWKEAPMLGANVRSMLGGDMDVMWAQQTKRMIKACGVSLRNISVEQDGTIIIE